MVYLVGVTIPNIWKVIKIPWFQSPPTRKMTSKFWFSCPHHTDQMEWANQSPWHRQTYPRSESAAVPAGGLGNHSFQTTRLFLAYLTYNTHFFPEKINHGLSAQVFCVWSAGGRLLVAATNHPLTLLDFLGKWPEVMTLQKLSVSSRDIIVIYIYAIVIRKMSTSSTKSLSGSWDTHGIIPRCNKPSTSLAERAERLYYAYQPLLK